VLTGDVSDLRSLAEYAGDVEVLGPWSLMGPPRAPCPGTPERWRARCLAVAPGCPRSAPWHRSGPSAWPTPGATSACCESTTAVPTAACAAWRWRSIDGLRRPAAVVSASRAVWARRRRCRSP